jgi:hypothetical protein
MRGITLWTIAAVLVFCNWPSSVMAQRPGLEVPLVTPGPGWKTCVRCENDAHIFEARKQAAVGTRQFDPHDISGVWGDMVDSQAGPTSGANHLDTKAVPPMTPYGRKLYEETKSSVGPGGVVDANSKDPEVICDPVGFPRQFAYNYGMEFVQLPNRVLQFFEWGHTWRTIWTDGRKLPTDPPVARFEGYAVGSWDGDTFVVESDGYDDRSWLSADRDLYGFRHSSEMRVEERYKRLDYGRLQGSVTIIDPKVYTKPWITTGISLLVPNAEIGEYMCVTSDSIRFNETQTEPSVGLTPDKK